jgi:hypothetical protein
LLQVAVVEAERIIETEVVSLAVLAVQAVQAVEPQEALVHHQVLRSHLLELVA